MPMKKPHTSRASLVGCSSSWAASNFLDLIALLHTYISYIASHPNWLNWELDSGSFFLELCQRSWWAPLNGELSWPCKKQWQWDIVLDILCLSKSPVFLCRFRKHQHLIPQIKLCEFSEHRFGWWTRRQKVWKPKIQTLFNGACSTFQLCTKN